MVNLKRSIETGAAVGKDTTKLDEEKKYSLQETGESEAKHNHTAGHFCFRLCYWYVPFQLCAWGSTNQ